MIYVLFLCLHLVDGNDLCQEASPPFTSLEDCRTVLADEAPPGSPVNPTARLVCLARTPDWVPAP